MTYLVSIDATNRVANVFDSEVFVDPVPTFPITPAEFQQIAASGKHGDFLLEDGRVVFSPQGPSPAQIAAELTDAVQRHLDATAKTRGYDHIVSACSYAAAPNPFQAEGIACLNWRSAVWAHCYQVLAAVQAAQRPIPTREELLAELPAMVWP